MPELPEKGFYYHYKHDPAGTFNNYSYEVVGIARQTETKEFFVLYRPLYESDWFAPANFQARPLPMFMENVTKDGASVPRFSRITDPALLSRLADLKELMYGNPNTEV